MCIRDSGAEQCLGVVDVPALLERFHRRYPQVTIHFTQAGSYDLLDMVRAGELDAAFVASTDHLGALDRVEIGRRQILLLCPTDHPLATQAKADWTAVSYTHLRAHETVLDIVC